MRQTLRSFAFAAAFAAPVTLVALACSSKDEVIEIQAPQCPGADAGIPKAGDPCDVADTKTCTYPGSGVDCEIASTTAVCKSKKWEVTPGPIKQAACPAEVKQDGVPCASCLTQTCKWSAKCSGVYTQDVYTGTCNNGSWKITKIPNCNITGGGDAGTD